ncbi:TetR/AcrR family transcriptional regulator [Candidatus Soleaferrea massiliensis]|uniref:TetR/AcrR family transcriptional regulator n=1 Tax=Candidatus Soleaferrea massiliensis TaxID=1470354 RepID=UPI00058DACF2|nr:TetR/AcrR family transcriptional regulator [Candidatus Soleaferrea massiliensis]
MQKSGNDHRIRVTKLMIRKAFTSLLSKKPIQSISIKELCELAGINRGTFYAHYQDIYALLEEIEEEMYLDFKKALEPLLTGSTMEGNPVEICMEIFAFLKDNSDMCIIMLGDYSDKQFVSKLLGLGKEKCIAIYTKRFPRASLKQIEYFYAFASSGSIGLLRQWLDEGMVSSAEELGRTAKQIMLQGIGFLEQPL